MEQCPNCNTEIKMSVLRNIHLFDEKVTKIIHILENENADGYCTKCGDDLLRDAKDLLNSKIENLNQRLNNLSKYIPILSTHCPLHWDYDLLELVTGQTTTGTGVIAEFTSGITDFFGTQSMAYNKKLAEGEDRCFDQLRKKTLALGGNAIIAVDIDYAETGSAKGMLMVCMTGTAIRLKNLNILDNKKEKYILECDNIISELNIYNKLLY